MNKRILSIVAISFLVFSCKKEATKDTPKLEYEIVTEDIDNFWEAFDALGTSQDSVATFQTMFIDKATPEFKKFLELRGFFTEEYVNLSKNNKKFLNSIRPILKSIKNNRKEYDKVYESMNELYPAFKAPDICFAISPLRTGGTTSKGLMLIGSEIAAANPNTVDLSEISGVLKKILENRKGNILHLVAHEMIHTQQPIGDNANESLLSQAIIEGAASFISTIIMKEQTMSLAIFNYGESHEKELWLEFYEDVQQNKGFKDTDWFYNYFSNRPPDLGYYIGYKICESYYNETEDKKLAIKKIIEMEDANSFLENSKYISKFNK